MPVRRRARFSWGERVFLLGKEHLAHGGLDRIEHGRLHPLGQLMHVAPQCDLQDPTKFALNAQILYPEGLVSTFF